MVLLENELGARSGGTFPGVNIFHIEHLIANLGAYWPREDSTD